MNESSPSAGSHDLRIESRLDRIYSQLSAQEMRLADLILASPGLLVTHRANELSRMSDVSKSTTTRFFRRLGYDSYDEARQQARYQQGAGSPLYLQEKGKAPSSVRALMEHHLQRELQNIQQTYMTLEEIDLDSLVTAIVNAPRLFIIGYRHSQTIASMLRRDLIQVRERIIQLPRDGDTLAEYLADVTPTDLAICIGLRRRTPQMLRTVRTLHELGTPICLIADVQAGEPARYANWTLRCHTEGEMMFDSTAAIACLCNLITSLVGHRLMENKNSHLERVELLHEKLQDLD